MSKATDKAKVKAAPLSTHVVICIPSSGRVVPLEQVLAISMQAWPANCGVGWDVVCGRPVDEARNHIVESALAYNPKYLWFVDDDTVPPTDAARKLMYVLEQSEANGTKAMVASGIYTYKREPAEPLVFANLNEGPYWKWKAELRDDAHNVVQKGDVFPVWGVGAGCMMIRAEVFKHLEKPYFKTTADENGARGGEDLYFCDKVNGAGFKVLAHGGVLCRHWDMGEMKVYTLPEDSYPMQPRAT
jgi:hypothetical protein